MYHLSSSHCTHISCSLKRSEAVFLRLRGYLMHYLGIRSSKFELLQASFRHFVQAQCSRSAPDIRDIPLLSKTILRVINVERSMKL